MTCTHNLALFIHSVFRCSKSADTVNEIIKAQTLNSNKSPNVRVHLSVLMVGFQRDGLVCIRSVDGLQLFKPTHHQHVCDVCGNLLQLSDEWINGLSA